jgi:hypothetical protein
LPCQRMLASVLRVPEDCNSQSIPSNDVISCRSRRLDDLAFVPGDAAQLLPCGVEAGPVIWAVRLTRGQ